MEVGSRRFVHDNDGIFGQFGRPVRVEYVRYYNGARPSQAIHAIPDPYPELKVPPPTAGRLFSLPVLGGVFHDYRLAA